MASRHQFRFLTPAGGRTAFSLLEVVLALGIFSFAILTLLTLFIPTLASLRETAERDRAAAVLGGLDSYLQSREFSEVYSWVSGSRKKVLLAYFSEEIGSKERASPRIREADDLSSGTDPAAHGVPFFKLLLSASSVYSELQLESNPIGPELPADPGRYREGYLALEISVFLEPPPLPPDYSMNPLPPPETATPLFIFDSALTR